MANKAISDFNTDDKSFRLLRDEYQLAAGLVGEKLAAKLVRRFLEEGEIDRDGRVRYKIWEIEALPGGMAPSPYDGSFWRPDHERGIHCEIDYHSSSARWTGPTSAEWKAFDGRQTARYDVSMIRLCHELFVEFLQSAGALSFQSETTAEPAAETTQPSEPSAGEAQTAPAEQQSGQSNVSSEEPPPSAPVIAET